MKVVGGLATRMQVVSDIMITPFGEARYVVDHDDKHHDYFTYFHSLLFRG